MTEILSYFIKAIIAVGLLTVVGMNAPAIPTLVFPVIVLAYAIVSAIGSIYSVSVNRIYKQFRYTKDGELGRYNRRWTFRFAIAFIVSIASAVVFFVDAPRWDLLEWILLWGAAVVYYFAFVLIRHATEKEFAPRFRKAASITLSFVIVAVLMCLIYALIMAQSPIDDAARLSEAIQHPHLYFEDSPIVLLVEFDKIAALVHSATNFGLGHLAAASFWLALIIRFVAFTSVIFGMVGIFSFCMLDRKEIEGVFRLLPTFDDEERLDEKQPMYLPYIVTLGIVGAISIGLYAVAEHQAEGAKDPDGRTSIDRFIDTQVATLVEYIEWGEDLSILTGKYDSSISELADEYEKELDGLLNEYYDLCIADLDSYLDWYYDAPGQLANTFKIFPFIGQWALSEFNSRVVMSPNTAEVRAEFTRERDQYVDGISRLRGEYLEEFTAINAESAPSPLISYLLSNAASSANATDLTMALWPTLNSGKENERSVADAILPGADGSSDREAFKQKLMDLVDNERAQSLSSLSSITQGLLGD